MARIEELEAGESTELRSGVVIECLQNGKQFRIDHPEFGHVVLNRGQIRAVAEGANFSVKYLGDP